MPPHFELNHRFRTYKKNAQRLRVARTAILVASFVGLSVVALNAFTGPRELTRSALARLGSNSLSATIANTAALVQSRFDAAHIEIARSEAVAAANSASVADAIGSWFSHLFGTPAPTNITYDRTQPLAPTQPTPPPSPPAAAPVPTAATAPAPVVKQYITNPVVERCAFR